MKCLTSTDTEILPVTSHLGIFIFVTSPVGVFAILGGIEREDDGLMVVRCPTRMNQSP